MTDRANAGVICGQFGTVRVKFTLPMYVQGTVGDKYEWLNTESIKRGKLLAADNASSRVGELSE
jgi:hypothetical protein